MLYVFSIRNLEICNNSNPDILKYKWICYNSNECILGIVVYDHLLFIIMFDICRTLHMSNILYFLGEINTWIMCEKSMICIVSILIDLFF